MKRLALMLVLLCPQAAWAGHCTTATSACTEWVTHSGGPARSLVYRTFPLDTRNEGITRALVVIHGGSRNADGYYRSALAAGFLAGALDDTLVVAPRFAANGGANCRDTLAPNEVNWTCEGKDGWLYGGSAIDNDRLSTFDFADDLLRKLARRDVFPNLKVIVVAGHSAGGMFVVRYQMSNELHEKLGVPVTYIVANPSSYPYLDGTRPTASALPASIAAAAPGYAPATPSAPPAPFLAFPDVRNCTTYDQWPYGLQSRVGYTARVTDDQLRKQIAVRPMTYLLGELDILPLAGMDVSCPAMAQGPTRLARGVAFSRYVNDNFAAQHKMMVVPLCGHNERCMFTSEASLPSIFPKQ